MALPEVVEECLPQGLTALEVLVACKCNESVVAVNLAKRSLKRKEMTNHTALTLRMRGYLVGCVNGRHELLVDRIGLNGAITVNEYLKILN